MTRDVVIVPTYNRPEFLALCLEHLAACPEIFEKEVWVRYDSRNMLGRYWEQTCEVIRQFERKLDLHFSLCPQHSNSGNSYNVLSAYKDAYDSGAPNVYLVEDDVLISPDFFRWHNAITARHSALFCSVGWHCLRRADIPRNSMDAQGYFLSTTDYASIGVCWPATMLGHVVKHAVPDYFQNPVGYLKARFPNDPLSLDFSEQDGLIMRVLREWRAPVAWPLLRRCSHIGFYGYHRPDGPKLIGEIGDKINEARRIVTDPELLRKCGMRFGGDTEPVIAPRVWDEARLEQQCL